MALRLAGTAPPAGHSIHMVVEEDGKVTIRGKVAVLSRAQVKMLAYLADRKPRTCSLEQLSLATQVKKRNLNVEDIKIDSAKVHISRTRSLLKEICDFEIIETVRGVGYRMPNYVEVRTNIREGDLVNISTEGYAALVDLAMALNLQLQEVFEDVIAEGLKVVRRKNIPPEDDGLDDLGEHPEEEEDIWQ